MALTARRWMLAAVLGCGLMGISYLPPAPPSEDSWAGFVTDEYQAHASFARYRAERLEALVKGAKRRLAIILRRDSLAAAARTLGPASPDASPALHIDRRATPGWMAQAIQAALDSVWRGLAPGATEIQTSVIVDTTGLGNPNMYFLPPALGGPVCVVVMGLDWRLARAIKDPVPPGGDLSLQPWLANGLGPCAFYARFGRPGPRIEDWLLDRGLAFAAEPVWTAEKADSIEDQSYYSWRTSFDAMACVAGDRERCRRSLFPSPATPGARGLRSGIRGVGVFSRWWEDQDFAHEDQFFSDLIRSMGDTRFSAFWRSPAPVDSAFHAAYATSIEAYTQAWAQRRMPRLSTISSPLRPQTVVLSLLLAGVFLLWMCFYSLRRQVV